MTVLNVVGMELPGRGANLASADGLYDRPIKHPFLPSSIVAIFPARVLLFFKKFVPAWHGAKPGSLFSKGPPKRNFKIGEAFFAFHENTMAWPSGRRVFHRTGRRAARSGNPSGTSVSLEFCATNGANKVQFWPPRLVNSFLHPVMVFDTDGNSK